MLRFEVINLDAGNNPILGFAAEHLGDADEVTFEVVYARGDQARDTEWSTPDVVTVTRGGEVRAEAAE